MEYLLAFFWSTAPLAPTDGGVDAYPVDLKRSEGGT
jgi:hypothetical protein